MLAKHLIAATAAVTALSAGTLTLAAQGRDSTTVVSNGQYMADTVLMMLDQQRFDDVAPWFWVEEETIPPLVADIRARFGAVTMRTAMSAVWTEMPDMDSRRYVRVIYSSMTNTGVMVEEEVIVDIGEDNAGVMRYRVQEAGAPARGRVSRVQPDTEHRIVAARITANYALLLLDQDRFEEAWPMFTDVYRRGRDGVPSLAAEIGETRTMFGTVQTRDLVSEEYTTELPQALPGVYVVLVFNSITDNGTSVDEEVLMVPSTDRAWAVSGYRMREAMAREMPEPDPIAATQPIPTPTPTNAGVDPKAGLMDPVDAARIVSDSLLALLDRGLYDDAWPLFTDTYRRGRDGVSGLSYEIGELRSRFGDISRRISTTEEHGTDLPMALPGEYVLFGFDSATRNGTRVQEEVLLSPMGGGAWAVSSYTVRATQPARGNTKN